MQPKIVQHILPVTFLLCIAFLSYPAEAVVLPVSWRTTEESVKHPNAWPSYTEQTFVFMKRIISTPPQVSARSFPGFWMFEKWFGPDITFAHILGGLSALGIHLELFYGYFSSFGSKEKSDYTRPLVDFVNRNVFVALRRHARRPFSGKVLSSPFENENVGTTNQGENVGLVGVGDAKGDMEGSMGKQKEVDVKGSKSRKSEKKLKLDTKHGKDNKSIFGAKMKVIVKKAGKQVVNRDVHKTHPPSQGIRSEPSLSSIFHDTFETTVNDVIVSGCETNSVLTDNEKPSDDLDTGSIRSKASLF